MEVKPSKRLGQRFLVDKNIIRKFIEEADIKPNEVILEIGPGFGNITKELVNKAKVIAIERDPRLVGELEKQDIENVKIINGDVLKTELPAFDKCVSNIPFQISSKVIEKLGKKQKFSVLILQKEFAKRLMAEPGERNYSRISILAQYFFIPVFIKEISRECFRPRPMVDSAIVKLVPRRVKPDVRNEKLFFLVVRSLFSHKNQKISKAFVHSRHEFKLDKKEAKTISKNIPYKDEKVHNLSIDKLSEIANYLESKIS